MREQRGVVKNWKQFLNEAVGVPLGIERAARKIWEDIILFLENNPEYTENEEKIELKGNYGFSDYKITGVGFKIIHATGNTTEYQVLSMGFGSPGRVRDGRLRYEKTEDIFIKIDIGRPKNTQIDPSKVISLLKRKEQKRISAIAHELKHGYDNLKYTDGEEISNFARYRTLSEMRFGNRVVDTFVYNSYFTTSIENLVRPSELYTLATESGVTKKDFRNFLEGTEVYRRLKKIELQTYEDFREGLKKNMEFVLDVIQNFKDEQIPQDDQDRIDLFLKGFYITLCNYGVKKFEELLSDGNPLRAIMKFFGASDGSSGDDEKLLGEFIKKLTKYEGREAEYFKYQIGENAYQARQVIKKLGKIYSILPD